MSYLYINLNLVPIVRGQIIAFSAVVEFNQLATLLSNGKRIVVTTWRDGQTGGVGVENIREIRQVLGDTVDGFINDFLAANQK